MPRNNRHSPKRVPKVRIAGPKGRPLQLRYTPEDGREVRISTGTRNRAEAEKQKRELEARLVLGIDPPRRGESSTAGLDMFWDDFRESYRVDHLQHRGERTAECAESRLDIAERILRPRRLKDFVSQANLHELQNNLLAGAESRFGRVRSPFTVRSYMAVYKAVINWAATRGWSDPAPKLAVVRVSKLKHMKGRPLVAEEVRANAGRDAEGRRQGRSGILAFCASRPLGVRFANRGAHEHVVGRPTHNLPGLETGEAACSRNPCRAAKERHGGGNSAASLV